tara:strand:- start:167 stop:1177 length:1011 start_codon:yes stop_codon:yes gene_type:complete
MKKLPKPPQVLPRDKKLGFEYIKNSRNTYDQKWEATFFGHTMQKYGYRTNLSFMQLVEHIAVPQRIAEHWDGEDQWRDWEKASQKCFAPAIFKENRRLKEKVEYITMMVWDVDDNKVTYDRVKDFCEKSDLLYIMHTSYSHVAGDKEKFRVIFPMAKPIPVAYFEAFADISQSTFMRTFCDTPDTQALFNKASTYNCCYKTPHMRCDWRQGANWLDPFDKVQERFSEIQYDKSVKFLDDQFKSTHKRSAHPMHTDDRTRRIASLNACAGARQKFAEFMGARLVRGTFWQKWKCPSCGRSDATSFHKKHGRAFCNHQKSCGKSWLLPELASLKNWSG